MSLSQKTVKLLQDEYDHPVGKLKATAIGGTAPAPVPAPVPSSALLAALATDTAGTPLSTINWGTLLTNLWPLLVQYGPSIVALITALIGAFGTAQNPVVPPAPTPTPISPTPSAPSSPGSPLPPTITKTP